MPFDDGYPQLRFNPTLLAGAAAPLVYVFAVVLGGWLTPGYRHTAAPISALIMADAPAASVVGPLFIAYNVLVIVFAAGLTPAFRRVGVPISPLPSLVLVLTGLAGLAIGVYPMDPIGAAVTRTGAIHIGLSAVASLATMLAVLIVALPLRRRPAWRRLAGYSLASLVVIFSSGGLAAMAAARGSAVMGLWERMTIGTFLLWMMALALVLLLRSPRPLRRD